MSGTGALAGLRGTLIFTDQEYSGILLKRRCSPCGTATGITSGARLRDASPGCVQKRVRGASSASVEVLGGAHAPDITRGYTDADPRSRETSSTRLTVSTHVSVYHDPDDRPARTGPDARPRRRRCRHRGHRLDNHVPRRQPRTLWARTAASTQGPALRSLTPRELRYATGIASLDRVSLSAAFGTDPVPNIDVVLDKLAPQQRRYVRAILSMSHDQMAAAFGTVHAIQTPAPHR